MKLFLSHSTLDTAFVEKLADRLRAEGIETWLCEVDIDYGDSFVSEINRGLRESDLALLILSPEAVQSGWVEAEWTSILAREIAESRTRLGTLLLRDCEAPELLRTKHRIDGRSNPEKALREAVLWAKRLRDMRRDAAACAPRFMIDYEPRDFVGRAAHLERLYEALVEGPAAFLLHGEPGSGKSLLALKFAWRAQGAFDAVVFQVCGQRSVVEIGVELAGKLPLDAGPASPDKQIEAVKKWLRERRSLLVLDDVWDDEAKNLTPGPPASVLVTSRRSDWDWISECQKQSLSKFSEEEAGRVFEIFLGQEAGRHRNALAELARLYEHLPIAVVLAAQVLKRQSGPLSRAIQKVLRETPVGVTDLFRRAIEGQREQERNLLEAMCVCAQEGFFLPLAAQIAGLDEGQAEDSRDRLVNGSLLRPVERERQRFQLHWLLRDQLRRSAPLGDLQERHAGALERMFRDWGSRWQDCRECLVEVIPAAKYFFEKGEVARTGRLSRWGFALGLRTGALESALRITKEQESFWAGRDDREARDALQRSYGNQALILKSWGRLEEAMTLHKKEEALCEGLGDKGELQASYGNQALILRSWGRLEEAMGLHKKEEVLCEELGNKDGLQASYCNQALILQIWGRLEEAMALLEKQEALCLELGDRDSLQVSYCNQAFILQSWGRLEEAMILRKKEEAICLELGNKNGLQRSFSGQASILQSWGRLEEAMALFKKQEALCLELGNKDGLQASYCNQAVILHSWGRLEEAMALLKKQEALCLELGSKDGLQASCCNQAVILQSWGRLEEAMALYKKGEAICLELGNKDGLQRSYGGQAVILRSWGWLNEATALHKRQEAICLELANKEGLASCYWHWGLLARALGDRKTERGKLQAALELFKELNMPRERDEVRSELSKSDS
jgi:tetratricopeptide (TPR) repeat protein